MNKISPLARADTQILSYDIIIFCHLRWNSVFQRPHHIASRLSATHRVLFVEEPIDNNYSNDSMSDTTIVSPSLTILHPRLNFNHYREEFIQKIEQTLEELSLLNPILWIYSPMFYRIAKQISHTLTVYDCMDELALFSGASPELIERESELLTHADVVFTGGKSLYQSKKKKSSNVFCFPSSVDKAHFQKATHQDLLIPKDLKSIQQPIVGFYGVIDERLDYQLLMQTATLLPNVSFVMIGPYAKIDPTSLPQRANIHYLGKKSYDELPLYLKYIDIAWMPFALNDATRFISPTKTLEFMLAQKPIISTPIYDVVRDYSDTVAIVSTASQTTLAIKSYLAETATQKKKREQAQRAVVEKTSWDTTVSSMQEIINQTSIAKKTKALQRAGRTEKQITNSI